MNKINKYQCDHRTLESRNGFTLLELVVSVGISSILIAGMTSSLLLAVQANNLSNGPYENIESASQVISQIDRELSYATEITTPLDSQNAIEFNLPDQNGDGFEELIRYEWSGINNDSLLRVFNQQAPQEIIQDISQFDFQIQSIQKFFTGDAIESAEQTWISQTSSFGTSNFRMSKNTGIGTDFVPTLPGDAISWSISSVDVYVIRAGSVSSNEIHYARVYTTSSSRTPDQLIDESVVQEADIPTSYQWQNVTFQNVQNRSPGERVCITFEGENNASQQIYFRVLEWSFYSPSTWLIRHYDSSKNWSGNPYSDMAIIVRGNYLTANSVEKSYSQQVSIELLASDQEATAIRTIVQTHNKPEVTGN